MKINQPGLLNTSGTTTPTPSTLATTTPTPAAADTDRRPVDTIRSVISSIYSSALNSSAVASTSSSAAAAEQHQLRGGGAVAPCGAFSMYYASLLLISHGGGVLGDAEWLGKVEGFVGALEVVGRRWRIAGEFFFLLLWCGGGGHWLTGCAERYVESIRVALGSRLGVMAM